MPTNYKFKLITNKIIEDLIKSRVKARVDLDFFKRKVAKKYKIPCPSNIELLKAYHNLVKNKTPYNSKLYTGRGIKERIEALLRTRPIRSLSGIVNISVLTKPYPCPGKCLYCPTEKGIPKSYVSGEPAVERAKALKYNPYLQVRKRIEMLETEGHPTDKIELRIVGGTWSFYPKKYQNWFIASCFAACNAEPRRTIRRTTLKDLERTQRKNEKAKHRIVGLSIETRPDFITLEEIKHLRESGMTMVELGVQSIYDDVLKLNLRGHGIKETIISTKLLKDAGFKVLYQMMPNLPGSNLKRDEKMFEALFSNPDFQPDLLKIYPCAILKEAPLYKWWKRKQYKPYTKKQLIKLIKSIKKKIPYYVRIQRIARDIPSSLVIAGPAKISNLRQILAEEMKKDSNSPSALTQKRAPSWKCKCIRCREVRENFPPSPKASADKLIQKLKLFRQDYKASSGKEIFLSFENKKRDKLYSLLRLRIPKLTETRSLLVSPVLKNTAIIREIHTYGQMAPLNPKLEQAQFGAQHRGLGKKLIKEAEKIVKKESSLNKIAVISAIGVRDYFRKLGYKLEDTYMIKFI